ncbi:TetR/AcrR family transcriptional regulator [Gordonia sinesedis]
MVKKGLTRDRLVTTAHAYVAEHGLDSLTMRRVATAAGVTPGALYKHFTDADDLRREMAASIFARVELADLNLDTPDVDQIVLCCQRFRNAMLDFRDGGRIIAGAFSPNPSTVRLSHVLMSLIQPITVPPHRAGDIQFALRSYTTGFVIEEQAFLDLEHSGEWASLVADVAAAGYPRVDETSDAATILTGDRDERFTAGVRTILTGTVDGA